MRARRNPAEVIANACRFEPLEGRQLFAGGPLDAAFGTSGKANPNLGFTPTDMAVQADGKIVLVGTLYDQGFMIARTDANGNLDPTFGDGDGLQSVNIGTDESADRVVIQPDGKILIAGTCNDTGVGETLFGYTRFALVRLNPSGSLDKTFDGDGKVAVLGGHQFGYGVADMVVQPDGRIVLAAGDEDFHYLPTPHIESDFVVARLTASGAVDKTFGALVSGSNSVRRGYAHTDMGGYDQPSALAIAPDGKIVVGGTKRGDDSDHVEAHQFLVARYHSNGTLDNSFDGNGKLATDMVGNNNDRLTSIAVQRDGKIVAGGIAREHFGLVRYNGNGSIDSTFNGGRVYTKLSDRRDVLGSLFIDGDGKITAVGTVDKNYDLGQVGKKLAAVQYLSTGAYDTSFGANGVAMLETGNIMAISAARAPGGKIVVAGQQNGTTLVRFDQVTAVVGVHTSVEKVTEGATGQILIQRDGAYDFPTRVYLDLSGPATQGVDYTSPQLVKTKGRITKGKGQKASPFDSKYYVDIPAFSSGVYAQVNTVADNTVEQYEVVRWAPKADSKYLLGAGNAGYVTIHDATEVKINFQTSTGAAPAGYEADTGFAYGARASGLTYGWGSDNTANARVRGNTGSPDSRYDTLNHMQKNGDRKWEMAVPNGMYEVTLCAGDPSNVDSVYKMKLENQIAVSGTPGGRVRWFKSTVNVLVADGKLTLNNTAGAMNNRVCYIDIKAAAPGATQGAIVANQKVLLPNPVIEGVTGVGKDPATTIFSKIMI